MNKIMTDEMYVENIIKTNIQHIKNSNEPEQLIRALLYGAIGYARNKNK